MSQFANLEGAKKLINEVVRLNRLHSKDADYFVLQATDKIVDFVEKALQELQFTHKWEDYSLHFDVYNRKGPAPIVYRYQDNSIGIYLQNLVGTYQYALTYDNSVVRFVLHTIAMISYELGKSSRYFNSKYGYLCDLSTESGLSTMDSISSWYSRKDDRPSFVSFIQSDEFLSVFRKDIEDIHYARQTSSIYGRVFADELGHKGIKSAYDLYTRFDSTNIKKHLYVCIKEFLDKHPLFLEDGQPITGDIAYNVLSKATAHWTFEFEKKYAIKN